MVQSELFFKDNGVHSDDINKLYETIFKEHERGDVGYYDLPESKEFEKIKSYCDNYNFEKRGIKNVAILGIGGSSLGTKAIEQLLSCVENRNDKELIFFENVDPNEISSNLKNLKLEETFFIMISKSGSTIETTSHLKYLLEYFNLTLESKQFREHFCLITDEGSPLDKFGEEFGVFRFYLPQNVGGRFSVLSSVGLLPLYILGIDIEKLLLGAKMLKDSFFEKKEDNLCKKALFYASNQQRMPINVLFSYTSQFKYFNDWYVQLWAESLGKINLDGSRVGLTPVGLIGSVDQHSFLQLIIEGPHDKSVTMIKVKDMGNDLVIPDIKLPYLEKTDFINTNTFTTLINAQCDATLESLLDQGVDADLIELEVLDEVSVGYMIFYYELLTSLTGSLLNIDTYNQPGVELGKVILKKKFEN